ncbi:MAG: hypothetical protein IT461_03940 [Planctomycetes bacterium]|nr:hypothetical protein [Planctomycetota bacterium]
MSLRRPSLMLSGRHSRGSWLIVALMLAAFGIVASKSIVPAWQEHQLLTQRAQRLDEELETKREKAREIQDKTDALSDPYYLAIILPNRFGWKWREGSEGWQTRHGVSATTVQK